MRLSILPLLGVLAAGLVYELLDLTRALPTGSAPGEGPAGESLVGLAAIVVLLYGFACFYLARANRPLIAAWLAAPAAGAFALAHFYSYDDYCGGYGCRIADEAPTAWKGPLVVAVAGLLAGAITWRRPRAGLRGTGIVAIGSALTVFFVPFGH